MEADRIERAQVVARRWRWPLHRVLIALGWLDEQTYLAALANALGLARAPAPGAVPPAASASRHRAPGGSGPTLAVDGVRLMPAEIATLAALEAAVGVTVVVGGREASPLAAGTAPVRTLAETAPELSAAGGSWAWQKLLVLLLIVMLSAGVFIDPTSALATLWALLALPFFFVVGLRGLSLAELVAAPRLADAPAALPSPGAADQRLPVYSILVPLYREAEVVPDIVAALHGLDYPAARLDVLFLTESDDAATREALERHGLPAHMRTIAVPNGRPRTKPRALGHGLAAARGDMVVVYDAEDLPEPGQLRLALAAIAAAPERIGCVQARLAIHNAGESWLTRQFAIEYSALFDATLPLLVRLGLPVPLGGTSNHFPRAVLEAVGGWDAYNVTEDADLGVRLARMGWEVAMLPSTTWEEAPANWSSWLSQRTRWLKGWMQTIIVHSRRPWRLLADLGDLRCLGFLALMGGLVLSALVHPWFYVLVAIELWQDRFLEMPQSLLGQAFWGLAALNLGLGYLVSMWLGAAAAVRRGRLWLAVHVLLLPLYWLAVSLAAHRALWQLLADPFRWEKTPHRPRPDAVGRRIRAR